MTSRETTSYPSRSRRIPYLGHVALLGLFLCQPLTGRVRGAEEAADPYDVLYDVIMTRHGKDGKSYAENESSPAIFSESEFPFGDKTYKKFSAALDAFGALPQTKVEAYSDVKRALLQLHLWKVFDVTCPHRSIDPHTGDHRVASQNHSDRRAAVQPKIASLIQRLALTRAQILALPDTQAITVKSGGFAQRHDPTDPFKPFLPADLYSKESSWVCIGTDETIPVDIHVEKLKWRSAFYSFIRLPNGRRETLEYIEKQEIPVGTQVALVEQAFLISDQGELILSPLVVSISLRAYLNVNQSERGTRPAMTQCVAEFVMQPRQLMQGNAVMKAMDPLAHRFESSEDFFPPTKGDPFEKGHLPRHTRLNDCMSCHRNSGNARVLTRDGAGSSRLFASSPAAISKATSNEKRKHETWKTLHKLWQVDSARRGDETPARADQPQPPLDNKGSTTRGAESAADPYDTLYDVIMTRHGKDGKAYGEHEGSPAIFDLSRFPFGDESYEKLNAALDAFATLPQSKVEGYSDIKRALLQRHLWSVFDATVPVRWIDPRTDDLHVSSRSHSDRRAAVQPRIALLIRRLALTRDQILALPDTMAATVKSGRFAPRHDPEDRFKPFLPSDLYSKESSWICLGEVDRPIPANIHSTKFKWRSAFLSFMRVPGGRSETLKWIEKFNRKEEFPVGTQFAFIEQAFLISNDGELILSPLIVSISLRAYVGVNPHERTGRPAATQCVAEFVMQPRQLMQGNAVMKAMAPRDYRFEAGDAQSIEGGADDPFETGEMPIRPRLDLCMRCHGQSNPGSVRTVGLSTARPLLLKEGSPEAISKATSTQKRDDDTWKTLDGLWQVDSARRGSDPREGSGQPPPPLDNNGKPEDRRPTATVAPRS